MKFDQRTLNLLVEDQLYFANPATFNDPLDTRPTVQADSDTDTLEKLLRRLIQERFLAEMKAAATKIGYRGPRTINHIGQRSRQMAGEEIEEWAFSIGDSEGDTPFKDQLTFALGGELRRRYDNGVVCLTETSETIGNTDHILMWSHYSDQHKGIRLGYSVPRECAINLQNVDYDSKPLVLASDISKMLDGDSLSKERVDQAVYFHKAKCWEYEKEWRIIGSQNEQDSCLELEEIVFGVRCESIVPYVIMKALGGRSHAVKYYQMREGNTPFELNKCDLDIDEELRRWPRRALSIREEFAEVLGHGQLNV
jgi:hypothetical protein